MTMIVYGNCAECGSFPINDATGLCEFCEEEAAREGEPGLDDDDDGFFSGIVRKEG